ncbi:MarR family winged helix-turn-helix transcriptional regulator [Tropicibacter oceani]|uniref:MarR family transcriptional regulator n=1 Tax=Tropicibacter oceani TaxID=3058420 RepID=A0ABY8QJS2_9RHOB|nr:MarR family transcriptional regulator [Tropicibacter oceani]WGW04765.1 MarR family transcriptional regulator [Tropicibacter oceani]
MSDSGGDLPFHQMAGHLIRRLHQISTQTFQMRAKAAGIDLTPVQFAALEAIAANPGVDQASVAALIAYDRATIGGVIDRLQQKGLITRKVSETDRRARVLALTKPGQDQLQALRPIVEALQPDILGGLSAGEQRQFLALAHKAAKGG